MKRLLCILVLLSPGSLLADVLGEEWQEATDYAKFGDRRGHAATVFQDRMWVAGGFDGETWLNDVWTSEDGENWIEITQSAPWSGRAEHKILVHQDKLWLLGGYDGDLRNDVWSSSDGSDWVAETEEAPWTGRSQFAASVLNGRMYILGGQEDWRRLNDAWYSEDGSNWMMATEAAPWAARSHLSSVVLKGRLYILGGAQYDYETEKYEYFNDVWTTEDGDGWRCVAENAAWSPRYIHQTVAHDGYLWLIGGDDEPDSSSHLRDVWVSADGASWTEVEENADFERRNLFTLVSYDERLWIIGGMRYSGGIFDYKSSVWFSKGDPPDFRTESESTEP